MTVNDVTGKDPLESPIEIAEFPNGIVNFGSLCKKATNFLVKEGLIDRKEAVRKTMLSAAMAIVDLHGKDTAEDLLPVFEDFLDNAPKERKYGKKTRLKILLASKAEYI